MKQKQAPEPRPEANQTVRLEIDTKDGAASIRIGFTDQRLTAHGGRVVRSRFLKQKGFRQQLRLTRFRWRVFRVFGGSNCFFRVQQPSNRFALTRQILPEKFTKSLLFLYRFSETPDTNTHDL